MLEIVGATHFSFAPTVLSEVIPECIRGANLDFGRVHVKEDSGLRIPHDVSLVNGGVREE
jgi:hypothetical protein